MKRVAGESVFTLFDVTALSRTRQVTAGLHFKCECDTECYRAGQFAAGMRPGAATAQVINKLLNCIHIKIINYLQRQREPRTMNKIARPASERSSADAGREIIRCRDVRKIFNKILRARTKMQGDRSGRGWSATV